MPRVARPKVVALLAGLLVAGGAAGAAAAILARSGKARPAIVGVQLERPVPDVPLLNASGRPVNLSDYRGKVVVLTPVLTLCHEVCPLATGALLAMRQAVRQAGLESDVAFAEVSVDPWRDSPGRLRAFERLTGVDLTILTGSEANLRRFWRTFGVGFFKAPQGVPPDVDWWTHEPETFDVAHTDGLFFVDRNGLLRVVMLGMPKVHGALDPRLRRLLNETGLGNLAHPEAPWTVAEALRNLGALLHRTIPAPA